MKQIFFLGLMFLSAISVAAQKLNVDSLVNVLETQKISQEEQMRVCTNIVNAYLRNDMDKLITYSEKGLQMAKSANNKTKMGEFYRTLAIGYSGKGDNDMALNCYEKALKLAIEMKDKEMEAIVNASMANMYMFRNKRAEALNYLLDALSIFESLGNKRSIALCLNNIGNIHEGLMNEQQAIRYFTRAKEIAEEIDDNYIRSLTYYQFAGIHAKKEEYDKAIDYASKTLDISRSMNDRQAEILSLQSLAHYHCEGINDYETAGNYAMECCQIAGEFGEPRLFLIARVILATVCKYKKQYDKCKDISLSILTNDSILLNDLAQESLNVLSNLATSYIFLGDRDSANYYFDKYQWKANELTNAEYQRSFTDMEVKYDTEKKELRIVSLEKEKQLYTWLGLVGLLLLLALLLVLWQTFRNARKEKQLIATRSVLDGEMRERARLAQDLHDRLSGNLSAVKIELGNNAEILQNVRDKLDNCIRDIREAAHDLMPTSLQSGLKVALEDFAAQFPNVRFHFFGQEKRIEERMAFVIYCCAGELVNNAVKHSGATIINLQLVQSEKHVSLTVQDNGSGFDGKTATKGIGLKSIHDRVTSCNGKIDISTSPKGTETTIELKAGDV